MVSARSYPTKEGIHLRAIRHTISIIALLFFGTPSAEADIIIFEHRSESQVTGVIGNVFFTARFVITAIGDTDDRVRNGNAWIIEHLSTSIEIEGVGAFDFITSTLSSVSNNQEIVGFGRADLNLGLFLGPSHPDFADWDMTTSIGPLSNDDGRLLQWTDEPVETTGGILVFDIEEGLRVTFTATVIPAPAALALFTIAGFTTKRRRRRQQK